MTTGAGLTAWQRFRKTFKRDGALHVMLLLPLLLLILYHYVPMAGIIIGFKNYKGTKGIFGSTWVGFENFQTLFQTSGFARALRNTVIIAVWKIVLQIAVPVHYLFAAFYILGHHGVHSGHDTVPRDGRR